MATQLSPIDKAKFVAAKQATQYVEDGMKVGLGTGSTAAWLVKCLGEMVEKEGLKIKGIPTSSRTAALARDVGIEVISLDEAKWLDLTIDGADEFDGNLNLIKGGGGSLLQEKIVEEVFRLSRLEGTKLKSPKTRERASLATVEGDMCAVVLSEVACLFLDSAES